MKLATLKNNTRDGELVIVSRDLKRATKVGSIAPTLQNALDNWALVAAKLQQIYQRLNEDPTLAELDFTVQKPAAPLPRAYQWLDGSAYVVHVELVRKARGAEMPQSFWTDPLMYQGVSDNLLGPQDDIYIANDAWGIDFESEVAVVTDDVPMGISPASAAEHIKLAMLVNDVSLRNLIPGELAKGFGFVQSKPASSFSPVAVTLDELGAAWHDGRLNLPLISKVNGDIFGRPNAGDDMTFNFPQLIAHGAKTRNLSAGTIIGSGTVANKNRELGSSCLAERRMLEILDYGEPRTPFLKFGDLVHIVMLDAKGESIFGAINQKVGLPP